MIKSWTTTCSPRHDDRGLAPVHLRIDAGVIGQRQVDGGTAQRLAPLAHVVAHRRLGALIPCLPNCPVDLAAGVALFARQPFILRQQRLDLGLVRTQFGRFLGFTQRVWLRRRVRQRLAHRPVAVALLPADFPYALLLHIVRLPYSFVVVHCQHLPLRFRCRQFFSPAYRNGLSSGDAFSHDLFSAK